jgi:predicted ATPase
MTKLNSGSRWHRWDPHIHAPGTVRNDQFKGQEAFEKYLTAIESASPTISALGITDYYSTETYQQVVAAKRSGRLPQVDLVFPNVEMRLGFATSESWVNIHLLVSPEDPEHLVEIERFLQRLRFKAHDDTYSCAKSELIRLGKRVEPQQTDDRAAFAVGTEQVKVSFDELRTACDNAWAKRNIIIAVAGNQNDGTSGLKGGAEHTIRREIETFSEVIFSGNPKQRDFWLGLGGKLSASDIALQYGALKPCLHGSDAHDLTKVGKPDMNRYTWIKGRPAFDTLRQAVLDPVGRAFVGESAPVGATPSQVIAGVDIEGAAWAQTPKIELNPGLVAIIGARGSGKTALADIVAHGCDATSDRLSSASFLKRAQEDSLLDGSSVSLRWQEGDVVSRPLDAFEDDDLPAAPRARYLSQKFVEELCSSTGMTDELLSEIERVVFEAHSLTERDGAIDFDSLREMRTFRYRDARQRDENALSDISERLGNEIEKSKLAEGLRKSLVDKQALVDRYTTDRSRLVVKGSEAAAARLAELSAAADRVRTGLRSFAIQEQTLLSIRDEVDAYRTHGAKEELRRMADRHAASRLREPDWAPFLRNFTGNVDKTIDAHLSDARAAVTKWKGSASDADSSIPTDADLAALPLAKLEGEIARLQKIVGANQQTAVNFARLSKRIDEETAALARIRERLDDAKDAPSRARALRAEREKTYKRVFESILAEEAVLRELYRPIVDRLASGTETIKKLAFSVHRIADVATWAADGEDLLDLRVHGPFKGKGTLLSLADKQLKGAWERGDSIAVHAAMAEFQADNKDTIFGWSQAPKSQETDSRSWSKEFAKWLYGTDHIRLEYSIDYDGVDIRKLSPGTRGIVLLLLYLALDVNDDRPLIIDQPEENLDPRSIFDELVGLFIQAKAKRQVVVVTHNANLVVNTDADQVIVATAGPHGQGELPPISYKSGGLEEAEIRELVCRFLEGGDRAFKERARRLRVALN